jgi:serine/threonine-protein phosphatase 5
VKKVCPNDKDALLKYEECKKIVTQIRFQKAIAVDESAKSMANQIEIQTMSTSSMIHHVYLNLYMGMLPFFFSLL